MTAMSSTEPTSIEELLISFSGFSTWMQCQEKYRITRVLGHESEPAVWFPAGTAFHLAADHIDRELIAEQVVPF